MKRILISIILCIFFVSGCNAKKTDNKNKDYECGRVIVLSSHTVILSSYECDICHKPVSKKIICWHTNIADYKENIIDYTEIDGLYFCNSCYGKLAKEEKRKKIEYYKRKINNGGLR